MKKCSKETVRVEKEHHPPRPGRDGPATCVGCTARAHPFQSESRIRAWRWWWDDVQPTLEVRPRRRVAERVEGRTIDGIRNHEVLAIRHCYRQRAPVRVHHQPVDGHSGLKC